MGAMDCGVTTRSAFATCFLGARARRDKTDGLLDDGRPVMRYARGRLWWCACRSATRRPGCPSPATRRRSRRNASRYCTATARATCVQGGRRRQRRHVLRHRPVRHRGWRGAAASGQGRAAFGAGAVRRPLRLRGSRRAGGHRPAHHAGGLRHVPRLQPRPAATPEAEDDTTRERQFYVGRLKGQTAGRGGRGDRRGQAGRPRRASRADAGARTGARSTLSCWRVISAGAAPSTTRLQTSRRYTPTRRSATPGCSMTRLPPAGSAPRRWSKFGRLLTIRFRAPVAGKRTFVEVQIVQNHRGVRG